MVRGSPDPPGVPVIEFYPHIKWVRTTCVPASGMLFALRGLLMQVGRDGNARRIVVRPDLLGPEQATRIVSALGLDISNLDPAEHRLLILRHTLT